MFHQRYIILLLILITLAVYWRAASCQFVDFDDNDYINSRVVQGLTPANISWAFTTGKIGYAQPLAWLSLMLDSNLFGSGPRGYHVTNILLHALAAVLLYLALQSLTASPWRSGLVALLFALHPLRVESVAWVSERKDVLSGCLAFGTILAYAAYAHRISWYRYSLALVLFALGLLAKPMLVTLPCLLLLLDVWPLRRIAALHLPPPSAHTQTSPPRSPGWLVLEKIPFLILAAIDSAIAYVFQKNVGAVPGQNELPIAIRLSNIPISYVRYLGKMVWFRDLIILYAYKIWTPWQVTGAICLLLLISVAVVIRFRSNPWLAIGWFWFLGMLVPVIGFVPVGMQSMADRYTYLPNIGLLIMMVWSLPDRLLQSKAGRMVVGIGTFTIVIILIAFTWRQIGYFSDTVTLFTHAAAIAPMEPYVQVKLGLALEQQGHIQNDPDMLNEALLHLQRAVKLKLNGCDAHAALGLAYMHRGRLDEALSEYQQSVYYSPGFVQGHVLLGNLWMMENRSDQALKEYQKAISLDPDDASLYFHIGMMLATHNRIQEAIPYVQQAVLREPGNPEYKNMLAHALYAQNYSSQPQQAASSQP